jgi:uncharacterized SAM-binding protein YcdF (DUF218 family)
MPRAILQTPLQRSRALRCTAVLLAGFLLAGFAYVPILREIASFLIVEDSLEPAAAIIVLNGGMPTREIEAARIYSAGWAPVVVIVKGAHIAHSKQLQDLGLPIEEAWKVSREVLIRQGVPLSAIRILKDEPSGTLGELQTVVGALGPKDAPVILVTSAFHTRRARLTWEYVSQGRSRGIVRAVGRDSFDPMQWWHEQPVLLAAVREYLGIINAYVGFPISRWDNLTRSQ